MSKSLELLNEGNKNRHLEAASKAGWHLHTEWHWSRIVKGKRLDYWPSKSKFRYTGEVVQGDVNEFIKEINKHL